MPHPHCAGRARGRASGTRLRAAIRWRSPSGSDVPQEEACRGWQRPGQVGLPVRPQAGTRRAVVADRSRRTLDDVAGQGDGSGGLQHADRGRCQAPPDRRARRRTRPGATEQDGAGRRRGEAMAKPRLRAYADRGYFNGPEIKACEDAGILAFVPKPMTSNAKADGRFGKADFIYIARDDEYLCPAGQIGERAADPSLLEQRLPGMPDEASVHPADDCFRPGANSTNQSPTGIASARAGSGYPRSPRHDDSPLPARPWCRPSLQWRLETEGFLAAQPQNRHLVAQQADGGGAKTGQNGPGIDT